MHKSSYLQFMAVASIGLGAFFGFANIGHAYSQDVVHRCLNLPDSETDEVKTNCQGALTYLKDHLTKEDCGQITLNVGQFTGATAFQDLARGIVQGCVTVFEGAAACESGNIGPAGCCMEKVTTKTIKVQGEQRDCIDEVEKCGADKGGKKIFYTCCVCNQGDDKVLAFAGSSRYTKESCEKECKERYGGSHADVTRGAGALPLQTETAPTPEEMEQKLAFCFKPDLCATQDYGGSPSAFRPGFGCPAGEGRCIAPEPDVKLSYPIGGVSTVKGFRGFVSTVFKYLIGIVGTVAAVMFVYAGFRYIFGSAFEDIKRAKEIMVDAAIGLVLVLGVVAILRTVNPTTLNLNRLEVFMINKSRILLVRACMDVVGDAKFAYAGDRPAYTPVDKVTEYPLTKDQTMCNKEYYVDGFGSFRCNGMTCPEEGEGCVSCRDPEFCRESSEQKVDALSYTCTKGTWVGNISYQNERNIDIAEPVFICNAYMDAVKNGDIPSSDTGPFIMEAEEVRLGDAFADFNAALKGTEPGSVEHEKVQNKCKEGIQTYVLDITNDDLDAVEDRCKDHGGVYGVVIGINYNDPGSILCHSVFSNDESAIVGKSNCGNGNMFQGYYDPQDDDASTEREDVQNAFACGALTTNGKLRKRSEYWTIEELRAAAKGKVIQCNFQITDRNGVSDAMEKATSKAYFDFLAFGGLTKLACPANGYNVE